MTSFMLAKNIYEAAKDHARYCTREDCPVSVFQLQLAARDLIAHGVLSAEESEEVRSWIWPL
jgi:hypothetical protein